MLNIHFGGESLNKEKYMFDKIKKTEGKVLLLVPDQFTLQAEKEAFYYLEARGLIDLEILSFSRLGTRITAETGGSGRAKIDAYGRYMLLTKITAENREKLTLFKNGGKLSSFAQMANDLIYEMKQYNTAPADILKLSESMEKDLILKRKLEDIYLLYCKYEEYTNKKYLDGEDYLAFLTSKIEESLLTRDSVLWIYGFDYFTPKNMQLLKELMKHAREMNILLTYENGGASEELFEITGLVKDKLEKLAAQNDVVCNNLGISSAYAKENKRASLSIVERELFSGEQKTYGGGEGITLITAANPYSEIETAAAYVLELVRGHGLKYKDIAIICNDLDERAIIAGRVFSEYGIDLFIDQKRSFTCSAAVKFILSLLNTVINKYRSSDIFGILKSGMTDIPVSQYEELENYAQRYKIKGTQWKKEFARGAEEYEDDFAALEDARREFAEFIAKFEEPFTKAKTVRQRTEALYYYLTETVNIPEKLARIEKLEEEMGWHEFAGQTAQAWKSIVNIFDQLVEIMGEDEISESAFADVLKVGFESVEVGLLPPTADGLIFGTMERMRVGGIKALLIIGANEGLLPTTVSREGLLSEDEKIWLSDKKMEICRADAVRLMEEQIAIYKNLSKPESFLWISHSVSDNDGGKMKPAFIVERVKEIFPDVREQKDIISENSASALIQSKNSALRHMAGVLREAAAYEKMPEAEWERAADWYRRNESRDYDLMLDGLFYKNDARSIGGELAAALYKKERTDVTLSPSRLERYGKCPFSFFVGYGLFPKEPRVFEMAGREIGDIYHNCMMRFSRELTERGKKITAPDSRWMTVLREECDEIISGFIEEETGSYRTGNEEIYRTERIKAVCAENAWTLVSHVRSGDIRGMSFEEKFGGAGYPADMTASGTENVRRLPAIKVKLKNGTNVLIEGKIDRIDILEDGSVKIIDYKSGREHFDTAEARAGLKLQLMLYLKAAQREKYEPAGVFYFMIDEKTDMGRMDGVVINKASVIDSIAGEFQDYSNIIPIRKLKSGEMRGNSAGNLLSEAEFTELQEAVDEKVRQLCGELVSGCIDVRPNSVGDKSACEYCGYKSVCAFDVDSKSPQR